MTVTQLIIRSHLNGYLRLFLDVICISSLTDGQIDSEGDVYPT